MACMLKTLHHTPLINTHKQTADSCHAGCWSDHRGGVSQGSVCCSTSVSAQNITNQNLILFTVLCFSSNAASGRKTKPSEFVCHHDRFIVKAYWNTLSVAVFKIVEDTSCKTLVRSFKKRKEKKGKQKIHSSQLLGIHKKNNTGQIWKKHTLYKSDYLCYWPWDLDLERSLIPHTSLKKGTRERRKW